MFPFSNDLSPDVKRHIDDLKILFGTALLMFFLVQIMICLLVFNLIAIHRSISIEATRMRRIMAMAREDEASRRDSADGQASRRVSVDGDIDMPNCDRLFWFPTDTEIMDIYLFYAMVQPRGSRVEGGCRPSEPKEKSGTMLGSMGGGRN